MFDEADYREDLVKDTELVDFPIGGIKYPVYTLTSKSFDHEIMLRELIYQRIRSGENRSMIARWYSVRMSQITRPNGVSTHFILQIGQRLPIQ